MAQLEGHWTTEAPEEDGTYFVNIKCGRGCGHIHIAQVSKIESVRPRFWVTVLDSDERGEWFALVESGRWLRWSTPIEFPPMPVGENVK